MNIRSVWRILLVTGIVAALLATFGLTNRPAQPATPGAILSLRAPLFVNVARAETGSVSSFLDDEAGVSAYCNLSITIDLDDVRGTFRTIEKETSNYIIGSVPIGDYPESEDAHVYVHTDGWVLAYYLAADPAGKLFDWRAYDGTTLTTKLEQALTDIAAAAGAPPCTATYYDFRYPNATHLMLIAEAQYGSGNDSFEVNLPDSFTYYERSWSLGSTADYYMDCARYYLDEVEIHEHCHNRAGWHTTQGTLTAVQLSPGSFHTIKIEGYHFESSNERAFGGLALVYRVP